MNGCRKTFLSAVACVGTLTAAGGSAAQTASFHIGNSLTWDSQPEGIEALAALRSHDHTAGFHIACSRNLNEIWSNPAYTCIDPDEELGPYAEALTNHQFDAVTLQPWRTGGATLADDTARVLDFIDLARSNPDNSDTQFFLYAGWPQLGGFASSWTQSVPDDDATPSVTAREYFPLLADRVRANTDAAVYIIPVGEVFFQLDQKIQSGDLPGVSSRSQLYRDSIHASYGLGRYVAGVTTYATLFKDNPMGLTAPEGFYQSTDPLFTPELYEAVHETVWHVVHEHSLQFAGDFNGNGLVEQADLDLVLTNWGKQADPPPQGWLFHLPTGTVDQEELDQVLLNWGAPGAPLGLSAANAVPEPGSRALVICAIAVAAIGAIPAPRRRLAG